MNLKFYFFHLNRIKKNDLKPNDSGSGFLPAGLFNAFLIFLMASTVGFGQPVSYLYRTPGTYIWTCPSGVTNITVECWGGGGAGGGSVKGPRDSAGGGAGGGAYVTNTFNVVPDSSYALFVGSGGVGAPGGNGGAGNSSWFISTSTLFAVGGGGGGSGVAGPSGLGLGGGGGSAFNCIPSANAFSGSTGAPASRDNFGFIVSGAGGAGGHVGASGITGSPGVIGTAGLNGIDGTHPGGGGSGGLSGTVVTTSTGGNGSAGEVIITYYYEVGFADINRDKVFNSNVFPNPTDGKATVQFESETSSEYTLKVFDITGQEVISRKGRTLQGINYTGLDMSSYAKGIYMIHLQSGNTGQVIKLVVH